MGIKGKFPKRMESVCIICGKYFQHYGDVSGKYCSRECMSNCSELNNIRRELKLENPTRYWLGKHRDEKTKAKISKTKLSQRTADPTYNSRYQTSQWKLKRLEIYKRDNWICQECEKKTTIKFGKDRICCHHIDYNHKNINDDNLITLCWSCHAKTNKNRPFWIARFSTERT
jgi:5-methylcytosine-specific restriction endonuclease McrA